MIDVSIMRNDRGVIISFGASVLFDLGSAEIRTEAQRLLTIVATVIGQTRNHSSIEGHTDIVPLPRIRRRRAERKTGG